MKDRILSNKFIHFFLVFKSNLMSTIQLEMNTLSVQVYAPFSGSAYIIFQST